MLHHDGQSWTPMESGAESTVVGMWGTASDDVWLWTQGRMVFHWDGRSWSSRSEGLPETGYRGVVDIGGGPGEVYAVGHFGIARFDGERWTVETERENLEPIGVCATDDYIIAVTSNGQTVTRAR